MTPCPVSALHHAALRFLFPLLMLLFWLPCAPLQAQASDKLDNAIIAIDATYQGDRLEVRIKLRTAPATPVSTFSMMTPSGIVIDLLNTANASGMRRKNFDIGLLRSVTIAGASGRSRIVLTLNAIRPYTVRTDAETVIVDIPGNADLPDRSDTTNRPQLGDVSFRVGPQGESRILIALPGPTTTLDVKRQGRQIVTDIFHVSLPAAMHKRMDVSDFGTPVKEITIASNSVGAGVRIVAELEGEVTHFAYQTDSQLMIEVAAKRNVAPSALEQARQYHGNPLSLQFQNVSVRALLQVLADFTGINMIASDTVGGTLTLRLKDVPWDQALDIVLQARNLEMRRHGNVIWIAPRDEMLAKERQELEQRAQIAELEPLRADVFQLNYQKAETFREVFGEVSGGQLKERKNSLLSRRGSAVVDQRTNQLFVTDTPAVLENIRALLQKIDVAARQVLIEVRIVEADDSFSRNLGVRLGYAARTNGAAIGSTSQATETNGQSAPDGASPGKHFAVNLPASAIGGAAAGNFALSLFNAGANRFLDLELSALEADGKGKIISSPRVVTADQQAALIEQGEEIPYQQATSSGATATAFKKANLKLEVTPQIAPNGNVILSVDINKDSRGTSTPGGLAINTKHVKTLVQVENGGTVVIGGIYTQTVSQSTTKIPLLGDIPIVGRLFRNTARIDNKTELLIFLTPKIVAERNYP